MFVNIWISQVFVTLFSAAFATELLPERYLQPQDFNYHPITDVGIPASLKKTPSNPYAILSKKRPKEGREFPPQNFVYYPTPHPSVISPKHVQLNEIRKYDDPYVKVPKNYAFSYIVKDQHSGDDFSHSQAHNGKATKGEYRVKLPDGRTQIVSYTADHKGYRADVQYEEDVVSKPFVKPVFQQVQTPVKLANILPNFYHKYSTGYELPVEAKPSVEIINDVTPSYKGGNYITNPTPGVALHYIAADSTNLLKSTVAPQPQYVSTTATPLLQEQHVSPTNPAQYVPQKYVSSTPLYPVQHVTTAAAFPNYQPIQYHQISSTISPEHAVIVTPKPVYNQALAHKQQHSTVVLTSY